MQAPLYAEIQYRWNHAVHILTEEAVHADCEMAGSRGGWSHDGARGSADAVQCGLRGGTEAVAHGEQGHADALVKHAEAALKHAEGAVAETKNPHVTEAIKGLKDGIEHGKAGHADVATKAVENALPHLSEGM